jgi:hypothetical protein
MDVHTKNMMIRSFTAFLMACVISPASAWAQGCSPPADELRKLATELRASIANDNKFIAALDKAVLPNGLKGDVNTGNILIGGTNPLFMMATFPYASYRLRLVEAMRKRDPIDRVQVPDAVRIQVEPSRIDGPDIIKIIVERDGKTIEPLSNTLAPKELVTRLGAKVVLHSGVVTYPCSAFAEGATVTITAIPESGSNLTRTIPSKMLATLK